ncbi:MAG: 2-C-methyl-D-erythritol 2,4-cyclodiphosphate synthase [SAR324 cluster bacterium]|nr:2-C-methyl-D-erythritol 2,4-cyclodiphosphate synthase [SAR324 cluster bacterium]
MRIGQGYDVHKLVEGRPLILGGITIPHYLGLLGHSDADVLVHAIMDALLGALALGDIGHHFSDTDHRFKGADSLELLNIVMGLVNKNGYQLANLDSLIMAQKPKLSPYIFDMRQKLAKTCACAIGQISVKATTTEKLGFIGLEQGIAAQAIVLLRKNDRT